MNNYKVSMCCTQTLVGVERSPNFARVEYLVVMITFTMFKGGDRGRDKTVPMRVVYCMSHKLRMSGANDVIVVSSES
jgi:hypothetical protein